MRKYGIQGCVTSICTHYHLLRFNDYGFPQFGKIHHVHKSAICGACLYRDSFPDEDNKHLTTCNIFWQRLANKVTHLR